MIMRFGVVAVIVSACVGLWSACAPFPGTSEIRAEVPICKDCNVVLISMDTLRADHLGAYGHPSDISPNIDMLARSSVLFENAISQSAWTRPAHISMFTGLYPAEHGVVSIRGHKKVPTGVPTLAESLKQRGYTTAAFTGGANMSARFGFDRGFDVYDDSGRHFRDHIDPVSDWLDGKTDEPFFLFLHAFDPHRPYRPAKVDRSALGLPAQRPTGLAAACGAGAGDVSALVGEYAGAVRRGDRALGELLSRVLHASPVDRTVIVFTSDHGEEFLEHGGCFHLRTLHREVVHVPLIIRAPGLTPGRVADVVAASVSVAPTILGLLGVEDSEIPGPSLVPELARRRTPTRAVVSETWGPGRPNRRGGHQRSVTSNREKLIAYLRRGHYAYYDVEADPAELSPLGAGPSSKRLTDWLDAWIATHPRRGEDDLLTRLPKDLEADLRALGYLEGH